MMNILAHAGIREQCRQLLLLPPAESLSTNAADAATASLLQLHSIVCEIRQDLSCIREEIRCMKQRTAALVARGKIEVSICMGGALASLCDAERVMAEDLLRTEELFVQLFEKYDNMRSCCLANIH